MKFKIIKATTNLNREFYYLKYKFDLFGFIPIWKNYTYGDEIDPVEFDSFEEVEDQIKRILRFEEEIIDEVVVKIIYKNNLQKQLT
jgi:hypothetical protein